MNKIPDKLRLRMLHEGNGISYILVPVTHLNIIKRKKLVAKLKKLDELQP